MKTIPICGIDRLRMGTDGQGVRTLILTAGCPLRCRYCINKQTWDGTGPLFNLSQEQLYQRIRIDDLYFRATGGGITFGGGEPLSHADFIRSYHERFCVDWGIDIQTSLNVPQEQFKTLLDHVEHWFVDIKTLNSRIYRRYTGKDPAFAYQNLDYLIRHVSPDKYTIRIPFIRSFKSERTARKEEQYLLGRGVKNVDVFMYIYA